MDQLAEEQEADVVMAVSTVRKSRPQFIGTLVSAAGGGAAKRPDDPAISHQLLLPFVGCT